MTGGDPQDAVRDFQLSELKTGMSELRSDLKSAVGILGGQMTALQTQMTAYQMGLDDKFQPRREADRAGEAVKVRIDALETRIQKTEADNVWLRDAGLKVILAVGVAAISAAVAMLQSIFQFFPGSR